MKKNFKRTLSLVLAVIMTVMTLSTATVAFAATCEHKNFQWNEEIAAEGCKDGYTRGKYCLDCEKYVEGHQVIDAPHSPDGKWVHGTVKDCEEGYVRSQTCLDCKEKVLTETATKHEIDPESIIIDQQYCHVAGTIHKKCAVCGEEIEEEAPAKLHSWGEDADADWITIKEETCTLDGLYRRSCKNCLFVDEKTVESEGHNYVQVDKGRKPSCTNDGKTAELSCLGCGDIIEGETLSAPGHIDNNGDNYCDTCNQYFTADMPDGCYCLCHQEEGFFAYLWQILVFIFQLIGIQDTCACGLVHYEA